MNINKNEEIEKVKEKVKAPMNGTKLRVFINLSINDLTLI